MEVRLAAAVCKGPRGASGAGQGRGMCSDSGVVHETSRWRTIRGRQLQLQEAPKVRIGDKGVA